MGRALADAVVFGAEALPHLRAACADLCWLLSRQYSDKAALKLVGDRHGLNIRQRKAVCRCACSDSALAARRGGFVAAAGLSGRPLAVDGMNTLITLETALSGGLILIGRDGRARDLASVHGTYQPDGRTLEAIGLFGAALAASGCARATWFLDRPVSHSGELAAQLDAQAKLRGWPWRVLLENNPDTSLIESGDVVVSSDGWVLERALWTDLLDRLVETQLERAIIVDLRCAADR